MKGLKKKCVLRCLVVSLFFGLLANGQAMALEGDGEAKTAISSVSADAYDVMMILDKSGSMNGTDPEYMAKDAAKMFVDSLNSTGGLAGSRTGVICFSKEAELLVTPTELNSQAQADYVKGIIDGIVYDRSGTGGTDLGSAVKLAAETLEAQDSGRKKLILMFTDGYPEAVGEESQSNLEAGMDAAKQQECEIYIVGLNYRPDGENDSIKKAGRDKIAEIAKTTQIRQGIYPDGNGDGKVNYLVTDSIREVYDFYLNVYALLKGSIPIGLSPYEIVDERGILRNVYEIPVTEKDVLEANIFMVSDQEIGEILIFDQEGDRRSVDGESIVLNKGKKYAVLKLVNPASGTWIIQTPGELEYYVSYLINRGVELALVARKEGTGNDAVIAAKVMYEGKEITDPQFYQGLTETGAFVTGPGITGEMEVALSYDEQENGLKGSFHAPEYGNYHITVTLSDGTFQRSANTDLSFEEEKPLVPEAEETTVQIEEASSGIEGEIETDGPGQGVDILAIAFKGSVAVLLLVLLAVVIQAIYSRFFRKLNGEFKVTLEEGGLLFAHTFTELPFGGKEIRVDTFLKKAVKRQFEQDREAQNKLLNAISAHGKRLHEIKIVRAHISGTKKGKESYYYREKGSPRNNALGGDIFKDYEPEDRNLRLRVALDFISQAEMEADGKGW